MTLNKIQLWCIGSFILLAYYAGEKYPDLLQTLQRGYRIYLTKQN